MEILREIIQELTEVKVDSIIMSGNVLVWAKRIKAQRAISTVLSSLTEAKEFDKIKISRNACKDSLRRTTQTRTPTKQTCRYCRSSHPQRQCLAYGKMCIEYKKIATSEQCAEAREPRPSMRGSKKQSRMMLGKTLNQ